MVRRSSPAKVHDERRFPVRVRVAVPPQGFGNQLNAMHEWLNEHAGKGNYASHGSTQPGVPDASLWYFLDVGMAKAFVDRFGCGLLIVDRKAERW
jgi:hypothetical protein